MPGYEVSYVTVWKWFRRFKGGLELIKDAPISERKKSVITPKTSKK